MAHCHRVAGRADRMAGWPSGRPAGCRPARSSWADRRSHHLITSRRNRCHRSPSVECSYSCSLSDRSVDHAPAVGHPHRVLLVLGSGGQFRKRLLGEVPDPDVEFLVALAHSELRAVRRKARITVLLRLGGDRLFPPCRSSQTSDRASSLFVPPGRKTSVPSKDGKVALTRAAGRLFANTLDDGHRCVGDGRAPHVERRDEIVPPWMYMSCPFRGAAHSCARHDDRSRAAIDGLHDDPSLIADRHAHGQQREQHARPPSIN